MSLVCLRDVTRTVTLPDGDDLHILRGVNLDVAQGEHVSIVGRSGTGKSTMLNIIGLLDTPTSGTYELDGVDTTDEAGAQSAGNTPTVGAPLKVTYHDACFLGRHNRVYEPPRELVGSLPNVELVEMPRNRDRAMCCGAGGAHAWFEETRGTRIADARIVEAAATGADVVATACPFCSQMLGSASGTSAGFVSADADNHSAEETTASSGGKLPEVRDVAVMLLESVKRGQ